MNNTNNNHAPVVKQYRAIPKAHPAYKAFEKNVLDQAERDFNSVEEWLDHDDNDHDNGAVPYTPATTGDVLAVALAMIAVFCTLALVVGNLARLVF
ncbi:hypothetical protein [Corynebacterium evansiae]|uniref:hypothetical protein n=1 Tax=Corynebacterium evansiae TaxID=2913499 RepID=UPI003EC0BC9F